MRGLRRGVLGAAGFLFVLLTAACMRQDHRTARLDVPGMSSARDIRIVTNAALNEIVGRYDGTRNDVEVDVAKGIVLYHEGSRLQYESYRRHVVERLREVGYEARILTVRLNPPPPVPTTEGLRQLWPDRYTAVISVPALKSNTDANIVIDAIAYARTGDHPAVVADPHTRSLRVAYDGSRLARMNLEIAVAGAGYAVNDTPANFGLPDALPISWTPITIQ